MLYKAAWYQHHASKHAIHVLHVLDTLTSDDDGCVCLPVLLLELGSCQLSGASSCYGVIRIQLGHTLGH